MSNYKLRLSYLQEKRKVYKRKPGGTNFPIFIVISIKILFFFKLLDKLFWHINGNRRFGIVAGVSCNDTIDFRSQRCFDHHSVFIIGDLGGNRASAIHPGGIDHFKESK